MTPPRARRYELGLLVAAVLAVIVYWPALGGPFIFDDLEAIPQNPHLRSLRPLAQAMSAPSGTTLSGRPVVSLSFAVNYAVGGLDPRGYRALNLVLHVATAVLIAEFVRRTLAARQEASAARSAAPQAIALAIAALWLLHPLQTECVSYVVQRTETLMGFFYVLTLYAAARGARAERPGRWYALAIAACALGMGSKESMATAPLAVLLWDRCFAAGAFAAALRRRPALYAGLAATWLVLAAVLAGGHRATTVGAALGVSPLEYLRTQAGVVLHYLRLVVWPWPLAIVYDDWPVATLAASAAPLAVMAFLAAAAGVLLKRRSPLGFPAAMFFLLLAPTSSVVPIITEFAAERRMHLPLAAVLGLVVPAIWTLVTRADGRPRLRPQRGVATGALAIVIVFFSSVSWQRNRQFATAASIWRSALAARPESVTARMNLGNALHAARRYEEAAELYAEAARRRPDDYRAFFNLANALLAGGDVAGALAAYDAALMLRPDLAELHDQRGVALTRVGRLPEAAAAHRASLALEPGRASAWSNLGVSLARQGQRADAEGAYRRALELSPALTEGKVNLADLLLEEGRFEEAERQYRELLQATPDSSDVRLHLAIALAMQRREGEAAAELQALLRSSPEHMAARQMLADLSKVPPDSPPPPG